MSNKFLYSFLKDPSFRIVCVLPFIGLAICFVLLRVNTWQGSMLKVTLDRQALVAQIPAMEAKIAQMTQKKKIDIGYTLNGIISGKDKPMAAINNTLVSVGDEIGDKTVSAITSQGVRLCDTNSTDKCIDLALDQ